MDKIYSSHVFTPLQGISINVGEKDASLLPIDQCYSTSNNINPVTGFPYTDIQIVMRAQSLSERTRLMNDLQVMKPDFIDAEVTDDDALKMVSSRSSQLPSELLDDAKENVIDKVSKHNKKAAQVENKKLYDDFVKRTSPKSELKNE